MVRRRMKSLLVVSLLVTMLVFAGCTAINNAARELVGLPATPAIPPLR